MKGRHKDNPQNNRRPSDTSCALSQFRATRNRWSPSNSQYESFVSGLDVTKSTASKIEDIVQLACEPVCGEDNTRSKVINLLLDDCCLDCPIDTVVSYVTCLGYDLLQLFAAHGLYETVEHTLQLGYNVSLLTRPCSSPLHLACKNHHFNITELFLRHGAELNCSSTTCFPSEHLLVSASDVCEDAYSNPQMRWTQCTSKRQSLISLALCSDNVDMIHVLMQEDYLKCLDTRMVLYDACERKAVRCLEFMVPLLPEQANQRYGFQDNLSLFSIAFSKSVNCGRVLLQSNISWKQDVILRVNASCESLLHLVLQYPDMPLFYSMVQVTLEKYLMNEHINALDLNGNSPLLVLLRMIGRQITPVSKQYRKNVGGEMFDILRYLVHQGADVHVRNKAGKTVLHVLLPEDIDYYPTVCVQSLPEINRVIEYLLQFNIDLNNYSAHVTHPLVWAVKILSRFSVYTLETAWSPFYDMVSLLLDHGATPNVEVERGIHIINIIFSAVSHWLKQSTADGSLECGCCMLHHMTSVIRKLLEHGMHISGDVLELCIKQIMILCNIGMPQESLIRSDVLVQQIGMILRLFFVHGVDPHKLEMVTEQQADSAPSQLHALFYLARAFIVHKHTNSMFQILSILECSLNQRHLNNLLTSLCVVLTNNFNLDQDTSECIRCIRARQTNARSLQTLCKVIVSEQLNWQLRDRVPLLRLPKELLGFLLYYVVD